jgi:hypothetical protein
MREVYRQEKLVDLRRIETPTSFGRLRKVSEKEA